MAYGSWSGTAWKQVWTNNYYALDVEWQYRQDPVANKTEYRTTRWRCRSLVYTYSLSAPVCVCGIATITAQRKTSVHNVNVPQVGSAIVNLTDDSRVFTHNSDGTHGTPYVHGYIDSNIGNDWNYNPYQIGWKTAVVSIPNIDRSGGSGTVSNSNVTYNSVTITYKPNVACDVIQYKIGNGSWVTTGKRIDTAGGGTVSFNITGLTENTNYTVYVRHKRGYNQVYSGSASTSFKTKISTDAGTATIAQGNVTTSSATVIYTPQYPSNLIEYSIDGGAWTNSGLTTTSNNQAVSINLTGLSANTEYTFSVRHRRTSNQVVSSAMNITVKTTVGTSRVVSVTTESSSDSVYVTWTYDAMGSTISYFTIFVEEESSEGQRIIEQVTYPTNEVTITGLKPDTAYMVTVTPVQSDHTSGVSKLVRFVTLADTGGKIYIKKNGIWRKGTLWYKLEDTWKQVKDAFVKDGTWK